MRLLAWLSVALLTGCYIPIAADGVVRLQGEAVDQTGRPFDQCALTLHDKNGKPLQTTAAPGIFSTSFAIEPTRRTYFTTMSCVGSPAEARSAPFPAGTVELYEKPVELGRFILER